LVVSASIIRMGSSRLHRYSVCIVSVLRLNALIIVSRNPQDATWYGSAPAYWSAIEMNLAIVCASTPALKPLIVKMAPSFSSRHGTNASSERTGTYKESRFHNSFLRLGGMKSSSEMSNSEVEQGTMDTELIPVTALPPVHAPPNQGQIHVTRDFEQQSSRRPSDSSSQRLFSQAQAGSYAQR